MDLRDLSTLKQMLLDAQATIDDLRGVMQFFFDNFGNDQSFLQEGQPATDKNVDGMLQGLAQRLFGVDIDMTGTPLVELPAYHFMHGAFQMQSKSGTVIYFTDVGKGLIAIAWPRGQTTYTPFTVAGPFRGDAATGLAKYRRFFENR